MSCNSEQSLWQQRSPITKDVNSVQTLLIELFCIRNPQMSPHMYNISIAFSVSYPFLLSHLTYTLLKDTYQIFNESRTGC